jgi:hypothetical protein
MTSATPPREIQVASLVLAICGITLVVVAVIHLWISPLLYTWFGRSVPDALPVLGPPFLLNHVVVGVLLLPLGINTLIASFGVRVGDRRAWQIACVNSLAVAVLPLLLVAIMRGPDYTAGPFRVAETLLTLAAFGMLAAVLLARKHLGFARAPA